MLYETSRRCTQLVVDLASLAIYCIQHVELFLLDVGACNHMLCVVKINAAYRLLLQLSQLFDLLLVAVELFGL